VISPRVGLRGALVVATAVAVVASISGVAWAYWTAQATNVPTYSYADSVGTGNQPTATVNGTSVGLSWPASTTAAGRDVGGYLVSRYPGASGGSATAAAQGTCAAIPVTALTCTEANVPAGTWYYAVTPILGSWRGNESPRSTGAPVAGVATFALSWPSGTTTLTAGSGTNLTITARTGDQTDTGYTGAHALTFGGLATAPNGTAPSYNNGNASVTFTAGVATVPVTLFTAEAATLTVTAGAVTGSLAVTVNPAAAAQFLVAAPQTATAGAPLSITLTAADAYKNTATGYAGGKTLTWSGPGNAPDGRAPGYPANPVTFTAGVATNLPVTLYRAETTTLTAAADTITGTSGTFPVLAAAASQFAVSTPSPQTAGAQFTVTVSALDAYKNAVNGYTGGKTLTWSGQGNAPDGRAPSYPANPVTFTDGVATNLPVTLVLAGNTTLTVKDGTTTGTSGTVSVNPAAAARLAWTNPSATTGGTLSSPCLFSCAAHSMNNRTFSARVSATDSYGNTVNLGTATSVTVSREEPSGGNVGTFTAPPGSASITLTISAGQAQSEQFTFQAPNGSWTSNTLNAAGGGFTAASAVLFKS